MARVDNRLVYGMIEDVFDLAAAYCVAVAAGIFATPTSNTHLVLDICLDLNGVQLDHETIEAGDLIRDAQGHRRRGPCRLAARQAG